MASTAVRAEERQAWQEELDDEAKATALGEVFLAALKKTFCDLFGEVIAESLMREESPDGVLPPLPVGLMVPKRPFSSVICHRLLNWLMCGHFPVSRDVGLAADGVPAASVPHQLLDALLAGETLSSLHSTGKPLLFLPPSSLPSPELKSFAHRLIEGLSLRGVLALLGLGRTEGTQDAAPPSSQELWVAFQQPLPGIDPKHVPMTVGGRALCKHAARSTERFWGDGHGGSVKKNADATDKLMALMADAQWMNLHLLPPYDRVRPCFEIRNSQGYGARWMLEQDDGGLARCVFRGFLEPQSVAGHTTGWIH